MNRNSSEERARSSLFLGFALLLVLAFLFNYMERAAELLAVQADVTNLREDIAWAKQWNLQLQDELHYYQSPEYVAEIARAELGYIQPGDDVYVVLGNEQDDTVLDLQPAIASVDSKPSAVTRSLSPFTLEWWYAIFR